MTTRTLVVMRHAKSSWRTNEADIKRGLSGRGTRDAMVAGAELAGTSFGVALLSPAVRVQQTWACLKMSGVKARHIEVVDDIYGAWSPQVIDALTRVDPDARRVLLIGHEPTVSDLVLTLSCPSPHRAAVEQKFPTSALAVLKVGVGWADLARDTADLVAFQVPRG